MFEYEENKIKKQPSKPIVEEGIGKPGVILKPTEPEISGDGPLGGPDDTEEGDVDGENDEESGEKEDDVKKSDKRETGKNIRCLLQSRSYIPNKHYQVFV